MNVSLNKYKVSDITSTPDKVVLISLQPKISGQAFRYTAGQYLSVGFKMNGRRTPVRTFSIVSSPTRGNTLQVAMRISGLFTRAASTLKVGDEAYVRGAYGAFVIDPHTDKQIVMIAGGIGVTPMMSMARWAADVALEVPITLLYSYRSGNKPAFYDELLALQIKNKHFNVSFFETSPPADAKASSNTVLGQITPAHIRRITSGTYVGSTYFMCGPPAFMNAIETGLNGCGVSANKIITESFSQSSSLFKSGASKGIFATKTTVLTYALSVLLLLLSIGTILALDLIRAIPRISNAQSAASQPITKADNRRFKAI